MPLAELIQTEFNCACFEGEEEALVQKALLAKGHGSDCMEIPEHVIANAILGDETTAPQYWPLNRFDLVWVFGRRRGSWTFTQVPQLLLASDRPDVIV